MSEQEHIGDIEVKLSYIEDMLETLNQVVIEQQDKIDRLEREVRYLREQGLETKADDRPPHY